MARKRRIPYAGAVYHVMARGNQGRDIYADDQERNPWLEALAEGCEKTGWRIHAWVMMRNRYHLLLETPEANLVAGMKWFQGTYTQRRSQMGAQRSRGGAIAGAGPVGACAERRRVGAATEGGTGKAVIGLVVERAHYRPSAVGEPAFVHGGESRVTQAIRLAKRGVHAELIGLREKLKAAYRHSATPEK